MVLIITEEISLSLKLGKKLFKWFHKGGWIYKLGDERWGRVKEDSGIL